MVSIWGILTLGDKIYNMDIAEALTFEEVGSFNGIHTELEKCGKLLVFLTKSSHKIKKKAEQMACSDAIKLLNSNGK